MDSFQDMLALVVIDTHTWNIDLYKMAVTRDTNYSNQSESVSKFIRFYLL